MTTILVNWNELDEAAGEQAIEELRGTRWLRVAQNLAEQKANPQEVYDRYAKMFPTRTGSAQLLMLAVKQIRRDLETGRANGGTA